MNRLIKTISTTAAAWTTALVFPALVCADTGPDDVTVYAGPQSVSPGNPIYVTVEATNENGQSVQDTPAVLTYKADGITKTLSARLQNGLVSFEVPAQTTAGHMLFSAAVSGAYSNNVLVAVVAGRPEEFYLTATLSEQAPGLVLSSEVITDKYGNPITDLFPVIIDWVDEIGLKSRRMVQLSNGRVLLTTQCPRSFEGALKIKAGLGTLQFTTPTLNALCAARQG